MAEAAPEQKEEAAPPQEEEAAPPREEAASPPQEDATTDPYCEVETNEESRIRSRSPAESVESSGSKSSSNAEPAASHGACSSAMGGMGQPWRESMASSSARPNVAGESMMSPAERADRLRQLAAMRGRAEAEREDMMSKALVKKLEEGEIEKEGEIEDKESSEVVAADIGPATVSSRGRSPESPKIKKNRSRSRSRNTSGERRHSSSKRRRSRSRSPESPKIRRNRSRSRPRNTSRKRRHSSSKRRRSSSSSSLHNKKIAEKDRTEVRD